MYGKQKLSFAAGGNVLLRDSDARVTGWDLSTRQPCIGVPGPLVGISRDGKTLLTGSGPGSIQAWDAATGKEIELGTIRSDSFEVYQRTILKADNRSMTIELIDVLQSVPPQIIQVIGGGASFSGSGTFDAYALTPDNQSVIVVTSGEEAGHDWAEGDGYSRASGKLHFRFPVNRFAGSKINFSVEHSLLIMSSSQQSIGLYDYTTRKQVQSIEVPYKGFEKLFVEGNTYSVHPKQRTLIAASGELSVEISRGKFTHTYYLCLLNITETNGPNHAVATVEKSFETARPIVDIAFNPQGTQIATVTIAGGVHLWDLSGQIVTTFV